MGQFDNIVKKAPEGRILLSIPREAFPEKTQGNLPAGNVTVAGVEGYNPKDTNQGGPAATSLPVRANRVLPKKVDIAVNGKRYVKPEEPASSVTGETIPAPSASEITSLRRAHAKDLKMQTVPGVKPTSQPWTPEEDTNPESTTTLELDEEASKKFGITKTKLKPKYAEEKAQAESGAETAGMIERHIKAYGKGPESKPLIEANQQEVKPGIEELRRERKLKGKRGIKNSGMFDKAGNPIESTNPGNQGGTVTSAPRVNGEEGLLAESRPADVYQKPEVQSTGTVIPLHNIFPKVDFGKTTPQLEAIKKKQLANQGPRTTTQVLDQNKLNAVTSGERSNEQEVVAKSKLNERFDAEERRPIHSPEVISKAKELAGRPVAAGGHGLPRQAIEHPAFEDTHRDIVRKAYVMHHTGITQDTAGTDVEKLEKYTGKGPTAKGRVDQAYKLIQNKERFEASKAPGTGYTYSPEQGNVDLARDKFKTRSGEIVPMSFTAHPEHPLKNGPMEGSAVGFIGFTSHPATGGVPLVKGKMEAGEGEPLHQGYHPYKDKEGNRVFEHHNIPANAVHAADLVKDMVHHEVGPRNAISRLKKGSELPLDIGGLAVTAAKPAPIAGSKPTVSVEGPVRQGEAQPRMPGDTQSHSYHVSRGINSPSCPECVKTASAASKERAAAKASEFTILAGKLSEEGRPPLAQSGAIGTGSGETRTMTPGERAARNPKVSEREGGFVEVKQGAVEARKNLGNAGSTGRPAVKSDIDKARADKHITKSEALELKVSSGSLSADKSKFKDKK